MTKTLDEFLADESIPIEVKALEVEVIKLKTYLVKQKARDTIDMLRHEERSALTLSAAAFVPLFALASQMSFLSSNLNGNGSLVAFITVLFLTFGGVGMTAFHMFFITNQRSKVEKFLCEFTGFDEYSVELNITRRRSITMLAIILCYVIGYGAFLLLMFGLLFGN